jgi:hypothetical protein
VVEPHLSIAAAYYTAYRRLLVEQLVGLAIGSSEVFDKGMMLR